jgi:hypothetical protein
MGNTTTIYEYNGCSLLLKDNKYYWKNSVSSVEVNVKDAVSEKGTLFFSYKLASGSLFEDRTIFENYTYSNILKYKGYCYFLDKDSVEGHVVNMDIGANLWQKVYYKTRPSYEIPNPCVRNGLDIVPVKIDKTKVYFDAEAYNVTEHKTGLLQLQNDMDTILVVKEDIKDTGTVRYVDNIEKVVFVKYPQRQFHQKARGVIALCDLYLKYTDIRGVEVRLFYKNYAHLKFGALIFLDNFYRNSLYQPVTGIPEGHVMIGIQLYKKSVNNVYIYQGYEVELPNHKITNIAETDLIINMR